MYTLLEYVTYVVLVAGAMAALFAACMVCVILEPGITALVKVLYRTGVQIHHWLPRPSLPALGLGSPLFKDGHGLVAVKVSTAEKRSAGRY